MKKSPKTDENTVQPPIDVTNVIDIRDGARKATGGPVLPSDWFSQLKEGTIFTARPKNGPEGFPYSGFSLFLFQKGNHVKDHVMLIEDPSSRFHITRVDPKRFSRLMDLYDVVEEPE